MKIVKLNLMAYGPFKDRALDFSENDKGLHIIFGKNEAGKSSALRAINGLLFGIPDRTADDFRFTYKDLRIGGEIEHSDGRKLPFVRRKGSKNTLLTPQGIAMDDDALDPFLSVGQERFFGLFSMDHAELVSGGQGIAKGGGDLGESLFAAGAGVSGLNEIVKSLDEQAGALFKFGGKNQKINQGAAKIKALKKTMDDATLLPDEWDKKEKRKDALTVEKADSEKDILAQKTALARLGRIEKTKPRIVQRTRLLEQLEQQKGVVVLPGDFAQKLTAARQQRVHAGATLKTAAEKIAELTAELENLYVPAPLLDHRESIKQLTEQRAYYRQAVKDLPELTRKCETLEDQARQILKDLAPDVPLEKAPALFFRAGEKARIQELCPEHQRIDTLLEKSREDLESERNKLANEQHTLDVLAGPVDAKDLEIAVKEAQKLGEVETQLSGLQSEIHRDEAEIEIELAQLPFWHEGREALVLLPVLPSETVDRFETDMNQAVAAAAALEEKLEDAAHRLQELADDCRAFGMADDIPSEDKLAQSRRHREVGWALILSEWLDGGADKGQMEQYVQGAPLHRAFEVSVKDADDISDRLRSDANHIVSVKANLAESERLEEQRSVFEIQLEKAKKEKTRLDEEWVDLWTLAKITPLRPKEMRSWIVRWKALCDKIAALSDKKRSASDLQSKRDCHRKILGQGIMKIDGMVVGEISPLSALIELAQSKIDGIKAQNNKLNDQIKIVRKQELDCENAYRKAEKCEVDLYAWQTKWDEAVSGLDFLKNKPPAMVLGLLDPLETLKQKLDEKGEKKSRIVKMSLVVKSFQTALKEILDLVDPELSDLPADKASEKLSAMLERAKADEKTCEQLKKDFEKTQKNKEESKANLLLANDELAVLCRVARCESEDGLDQALQQSEAVSQLADDLQSIEDKLLLLADSRPLDQLAGEAASVEVDELPGMIEQEKTKLDALEKARDELVKEIDRIEQWQKQNSAKDEAASAMEQAQEEMAALSADTERYLRLHLAKMILGREIERFRRDNQAPILEKAQDYFVMMTQGSFSGLGVDYVADKGRLVGLRNDKKIPVEAMSDGTADQLYLALRLAGLELHLANMEPVPFVLDDILVNFDDDRAAATLKILGEIAKKNQVLFFTHHSRLVDLAEKAAADVVKIHNLA